MNGQGAPAQAEVHSDLTWQGVPGLVSRPSLALPARLYALDSFRFLAAMGVLAVHFSSKVDDSWMQPLYGKAGLFVDFFFILSGFVIAHAYGNRIGSPAGYGVFLYNRIARIWPLHMLTFAAFLAIGIAQWTGHIDVRDGERYDPAAIVPNILMIHAWGTTQQFTFNYVSWSISAEWFAYLLFPLPALIAARCGPLGLVALLTALIVGLEAMSAHGLIGEWTKITSVFGCLRALPSFVAGVLIHTALSRCRVGVATFAPAVLLFVSGLGLMTTGVHDLVVMAVFASAIAAAASAESCGAKGVLTSRPFVELGNWSYAIYLVHPVVAATVITLVGGKLLHLGSGREMALWCGVVALPLTLIVSGVVYRCFEVPSGRFLRGLLSARR